MRKIRAKKIRQAVQEFVSKGIIDQEQQKNAYRFFKRAWKRHEWRTVKETLDEDGI
jgi:hypothetical protein